MKHAAELYNALKSIGKREDDIMPAIVKSVESDGTVTVEFDGYEMEGIRTQSTSGVATGIKIKPSIDSVVLLKRIGETNEFFVCMFSNIDEHILDTGNMVYKLNETGHLISNGTTCLFECANVV